ncbi:unnamed protein product, partial [Rotaria magnacalcarata]
MLFPLSSTLQSFWMDPPLVYQGNQPSRKTLPHARSRSGLEQRSVTFMDGTSTFLCDTPYTFSKTSDTLKYPSTTSTLVRSEVASPYQFNRSKKIVDGFSDS